MGIPATLSTVPAQTPYIQYVATSGQTVFPYPFEITQDSDLVAVANGTTLATDSGYTLSGVGNATGGNLTFTSGRTAGDIITLYRDIPIERLTQFAQNGGFSSTAFNAEFNNVYLLLQQLQQNIDQCLQIPNTNNPAPTVDLIPGDYANKYLAFDANGNPEPALLTTSGSLTQSILTGLLSPQTAVEASVSVTPTNLYIPSHTQCGLVIIDRYGTNTTPGTTDMTQAIVDAEAVARTAQVPLVALGAKYLCGAWSFGTNTVGAQSTAAPALLGAGGSTVFLAKTGATGTLISAKNIVGTTFAGFTVDCNSIAATGIDTSWYATGPSLQNHYRDIWIQNWTGSGKSAPAWLATNNNDAPFDCITFRTPTNGASAVGLSVNAPGGAVVLSNLRTSSTGAYIYAGAQTLTIRGGFLTGLQLATGATNVVDCEGLYIYSNATVGAAIGTEALTSGTKIQSLTMVGGWVDLTGGNTSALKARIASGVTFVGTGFVPGTSCQLTDAGCVSDNGTLIEITMERCRRDNATALGTSYPTNFIVYRNSYDDGGTVRNDTSGSYSPNFQFSGGNTGMTYSTNAGRFMMQNGFCFFEAECVVTAVGSSTGGCLLALPPPACNASAPGRSFECMLENFTFSGSPVAKLAAGATAISIYEQATGGTATQLTNSALGGSGPWTIRVQGFYAT